MVDIVIGKPLVDPVELGFEEGNYIEIEERFLPNILVELGFFSSNSEVRRNRPDLFIELNELSFKEIKIGKKTITLIVGN